MCSKGVDGVVRIPDRVKYISDFAFYWCRNIEEIVLPDTIEYIGRYAFYGCKKLKKIKMSGINLRYIDSSNLYRIKPLNLLEENIHLPTTGLCIISMGQL